jgi:hypothetical protein
MLRCDFRWLQALVNGWRYTVSILVMPSWEQAYRRSLWLYRGTSLIGKRILPGPYCRPVPKNLKGGRFLISEVSVWGVYVSAVLVSRYGRHGRCAQDSNNNPPCSHRCLCSPDIWGRSRLDATEMDKICTRTVQMAHLPQSSVAAKRHARNKLTRRALAVHGIAGS